jgi:Uma2 family endonuclease
MNAVPHRDHQDLALALGSWLLRHWKQSPQKKVYPERNVSLPGGWPNDYRIPDLVLTTAERMHYDQGTHIEGPPFVCIEIHSPNDEAYEKFDFYARLGVPEVWIIDRDVRSVEIFSLQASGSYQIVEVSANGWIPSQATGMELRHAKQESLSIRLAGDEASRADLPDD